MVVRGRFALESPGTLAFMDPGETVSVSLELLDGGPGGTLHGARYARVDGQSEWFFWGAVNGSFEAATVSVQQLLDICPEVAPYLDEPAGTRLMLQLPRPATKWHDPILLTNEPTGRRRLDAPPRVFTSEPPFGPHTSANLGERERSVNADLRKVSSFLGLSTRRSVREVLYRGARRGDAGYSDAEIEALRQRVPRLPDAYERFLRLAARATANAWVGTDVFFTDVPAFDEALTECARDDGVTLPEHDRLVFHSHQGYDFMWMDLSTGVDNPPVWHFLEGADWPPSLFSHTFTGWLLHSLTHVTSKQG